MKIGKYYLTDHGNILNVEKKCFQTHMGKFLRLVSDEEIKYLTGILIPVKFPKGIEEPAETPLWYHICEVKKDDIIYNYFGRNNNGINEFCYTQELLDDYNDDWEDDGWGWHYIKIIDTDIIYSRKGYGYIKESSLYFYAQNCTLQDILEISKSFSQDKIDRIAKNFLKIGIEIK